MGLASVSKRRATTRTIKTDRDVQNVNGARSFRCESKWPVKETINQASNAWGKPHLMFTSAWGKPHLVLLLTYEFLLAHRMVSDDNDATMHLSQSCYAASSLPASNCPQLPIKPGVSTKQLPAFPGGPAATQLPRNNGSASRGRHHAGRPVVFSCALGPSDA